MNIKKIIKEEMDDFDWINDIVLNDLPQPYTAWVILFNDNGHRLQETLFNETEFTWDGSGDTTLMDFNTETYNRINSVWGDSIATKSFTKSESFSSELSLEESIDVAKGSSRQDVLHVFKWDGNVIKRVKIINL